MGGGGVDEGLLDRVGEVMRPRFIVDSALAFGAEIAGARAGVLALDSAEPDAPAGSPFVLCLVEWTDLQVGMSNLQKIAQTLRNLGGELAVVARDADAIVQRWWGGLFPDLVHAAEDIRDYGETVTRELLQAPSALEFNRALGTLRGAAESAKPRTEQMLGLLVDLEEKCRILEATLSALHREYQRRAAEGSRETQLLREELAFRSEDLERREKLYHHYVTVAATSLSYAWIPFFGWIAGGAVAGSYGKRAAEEKRAIDENVRRIAEISQRLDGQDRQIALLERATRGFERMGASFTRVRPVMQHAHGIWCALASDLAWLAAATERASRESLEVLLALAVEAAGVGWQEVASRAAGFLRHVEIARTPAEPFGNYRTRIGYAGRSHDEHHILTIDLLGVSVNGVPVKDPTFDGQKLTWRWQADATRRDKPETADITFTTATSFVGQCNFPREGKVSWSGTLQE